MLWQLIAGRHEHWRPAFVVTPEIRNDLLISYEVEEAVRQSGGENGENTNRNGVLLAAMDLERRAGTPR